MRSAVESIGTATGPRSGIIVWILPIAMGIVGCRVETPTQNQLVTDQMVTQLSELDRLHELPGAKGVGDSKAERDEDIVSIELFSSPITGSGVETLLRLPAIERIYFHPDQVTDDVFAVLVRHDAVHKWHAAVSGHAGRGNMGELVDKDSEIIELKLNRSAVSPPSLALAIDHLPQLRRVDMSEHILDEQSIEVLLPAGKLHVARRGRGFSRAFNAAGQQATSDDEITSMQLSTIHGNESLSASSLPKLKTLPRLHTLDVDLSDFILELLAKEGMLHLLPGAQAEAGARASEDSQIVSLSLETDTRLSMIHDLRCLANLPNLSRLDLGNCQVDDFSLVALEGMTGLTHLTLGPGVSDVGLSLIGELTNLQFLCLDHTGITSGGLDALLGLKKLREFELLNERLTPNHVVQLNQISNLETVTMELNAIDDEVIASLIDHGHLHGLQSHFRGDRRPVAKSGDQLADTDASITCLDLSACPISGGVLTCLHHLPQLCDLSMRSTLTFDQPLIEVCSASSKLNLQKLGTLDLRDTEITEVALQQLKTALPNCNVETDIP